MKICLLFLVLFIASNVTIAQEGEPKPPYHQIFLENPVKTVKKVSYRDSGGEIKFKLSDDKSAIYLLDYNGKEGVIAKVVEDGTEEKEIQKSKCHIHSLPIL